MDFYLIEVGALNKTSEPSLNSDTSSNCDFLDSSSYNNSMNSLPVGGASLIPKGYGKLLGSYLAGLIEGDGSIIVPKTIRNQKGKLLYPIVKITFVEKDKPLALKIKEVIGGGTIVEYNNSSYIELLFQDVKSIQKIAVLLNGKMRTPKIEALYRLIDWLNNKSKTGIVLPKLGLDKSSLGSNPWLAGFIDSDGNFYCGFYFTSKGIAKIVKCYMRISQKILYKLNSELPEDQNSNKKIMEKIQKMLDNKEIEYEKLPPRQAAVNTVFVTNRNSSFVGNQEYELNQPDEVENEIQTISKHGASSQPCSNSMEDPEASLTVGITSL